MIRRGRLLYFEKEIDTALARRRGHLLYQHAHRESPFAGEGMQRVIALGRQNNNDVGDWPSWLHLVSVTSTRRSIGCCSDVVGEAKLFGGWSDSQRSVTVTYETRENLATPGKYR